MSPLTKRSTESTFPSSLRLLQFVDRQRHVRPLHERRLADRLADLRELVGDVGDVDPLVIADAGLGGELEGPPHTREAHRLHRLDDVVGVGALRLLDGLGDEEERIGGLEDEAVRLVAGPLLVLLPDLLPELREPFALGDKVIIAGRSVAIEITSTGVNSLTDREIADLQSKW